MKTARSFVVLAALLLLFVLAALALVFLFAYDPQIGEAAAGSDPRSLPVLATPTVAPASEAEGTASPVSAAHQRVVVTERPPFDPDFDRDSVFGRVVDERGAPIPGARVVASDLMHRKTATPPFDVVTTDGDGRFTARTPANGRTLEFEITAEGFAPSELGVGYAGQFEVHVLTRETVLEGVIAFADGTPAVGFDVLVNRGEWRDGAWREHRATRTDESGRFSLGGLHRGRKIRVLFGPPGGVPASREFLLDRDGVSECRLIAPSYRTVRGWTLDEADGSALGGVVLTSESGVQLTTTSLDGRFSFEMPGGPATIEFERPGYCLTSFTTGDGFEHEVEIPMLRGARVSGVVLDGNGAPEKYVSVKVRSPNKWTDDPTRTTAPGASLLAHGGEILVTHSRRATEGRPTDKNGAFELDGIVPGPKATSVRGGWKLQTSVDLATVDDHAYVELQAPHLAGTLSGVVRHEGVPTRARVVVSVGGKSFVTRANEAGEFLLRNLPAGPGTAYAALNENEPKLEVPIVVRSSETTPVDLPLPAAPSTIRGRVVDTTGTPVEGVYVGTEGARRFGSEYCRTNVRGQFEVRAPKGFEVTLVADDATQPATAPARDVEIIVEATREITVALRDPETLAALPTAEIWLRPSGMSEWTTSKLLQNGRGEYVVEVGASPVDLHVVPADGNLIVEHLDELPTTESRVELTARRGVGLELQLAGHEGSLFGVRVLSEHGRTCCTATWARLVDFDQRAGRVVATGLEPGTYTLVGTCLEEEGTLSPAAIAVPAKDTPTVRWTPPAGWEERVGALQSCSY